jgi:hypothetical protein
MLFFINRGSFYVKSFEAGTRYQLQTRYWYDLTFQPGFICFGNEGWMHVEAFLPVFIAGFMARRLILLFPTLGEEEEAEESEDILRFKQWVSGFPDLPTHKTVDVMGYPSGGNTTCRDFKQVIGQRRVPIKYGFDEVDWTRSSKIHPIMHLETKLVITGTTMVNLIRMGSFPYSIPLNLRPGVYNIWQERNPFNSSQPVFWVIRPNDRRGMATERFGALEGYFRQIAEDHPAITIQEGYVEQTEKKLDAVEEVQTAATVAA